jgi:hypothetical protein
MGPCLKTLREGQAVNFEAMHSVKGLRVKNVRMIRSRFTIVKSDGPQGALGPNLRDGSV